MKQFIQKLFGIDILIKEQKEANRLLYELLKLSEKYNKAYHIK